ncbi:MAG: CHASE3 domain-containing protein [Halopseudomonas aestusnigri]
MLGLFPKFSNFKTKPKILFGICSPLVLLLILGGVSVYSINSIVETNRWVQHTNNVLAEATEIVGSAVDMETGMRGYLLAGQEGFLVGRSFFYTRTLSSFYRALFHFFPGPISVSEA